MLRKVFGQIDMKWWKVIVFAVAMGVYVGAIAIWVPSKSWYHDIAVTEERWILPAILIIANCKKPLESALKTFVFFLISQPIIYLVQVPFAEMGWDLFKYYRYWFMITLFTFPGAFIAWFIKRDDIIAALILSVALILLAIPGVVYLTKTLKGEVGDNLGGAIYCFFVIALLIFGVFGQLKSRLTALVIVCVFSIVYFVINRSDNSADVELNGYFDTGKYPITLDWTVESSDSSVIGAELTTNLEGKPDIRFKVYKEGEADITVKGPNGEVYSFKASFDRNREGDFRLDEQ